MGFLSERSENEPETQRMGAEARRMFSRARQAWGLVQRRYKLALGGAVLVMAVTSVCSTIVPLLLGRLVDKIQAGTQRNETAPALVHVAVWYLGFIAAAYLLREVLNVARRALVAYVCSYVHQDTSIRLVSHLMKVSLATLAREKVGALHGRIFRSVDGFVHFLQLNFLDFLPALFTGTFALAVTAGKQPLIGLVMLGVIPLSFYLTARQIMSQKGVRLRLLKAYEEIDGAVVEQLGGMEYVRAANTGQQEIDRLAQATERRRNMEVRHQVQMSFFGSAKAMNEGLFHVLVLAVAIHMAIQGRITYGDVFSFSFLFLNVMAPLSELHRLLDEGHESSLRVGELLEMLAEPVDRSFVTPTPLKPHILADKPAIVVDHLHLDYSAARQEKMGALDDVSLTIRHGETIGIAGRSGGGKSTFLKMLLRLVHPTAGSVQVGTVPLESLSREEIGRLFGYVGQNPFVFTGTIAENIAYGSENCSPADIRRAAEMAHLDEDIMQMSHGFDTIVNERGQNLSGGQRQRLALARILLKQPPILVLDEATSALDNISEKHVQSALGMSNSNRTTLLVAHRLTTLRDADRIFVFEHGHIAEVGGYEDLLAAGGMFAQLAASGDHAGVSPGAVDPAAAADGDRSVALSGAANNGHSVQQG
jgi:ATP-binding cassette subfamily B protein